MNEKEFEDFLRFFSFPSNINVVLTTENVEYITKLADEYVCTDLLMKCEEFFLEEAKKVPLTNQKRTKLINISYRFQHVFTRLIQETAVNNFEISQVDLQLIENVNIEPIRSKMTAQVKELEVIKEKGLRKGKEWFFISVYTLYIAAATCFVTSRILSK